MPFPSSFAALAGASVAGLTSPTYDLAQDINNGNEKSYYVTALGGTQSGVAAHSNSNPFSIKVTKARAIKSAPTLYNGAIKGGGSNVFRLSLIKGLVPLSGQAPAIGLNALETRIPAGADSADKNSILAMQSLFFGFGANQCNNWCQLTLTNTL